MTTILMTQKKSSSMFVTTMTSTERRAAISLSAIMGLRMLGLFMVLPLFFTVFDDERSCAENDEGQ